MALNLSELKFVVDDSDLKRASDTIGNLVTNVGKLDKAARDAAQTEATLVKAAKLNADANLQNAKAQDTRLKSTITADKADQQAAAAIERKTKATEKATESSAKNVGVLQRQKDILEFQTQGFSRGQSSILSYAKAAGLAAEDIGELGKVLETQRKLMGGDPFDKSLSGLKSLQNQYTELKESVRQYATDSNLTAKQTRELARDKERLIEKMKVEGASFSEIRKAVRAHNTEYVNIATSYNKMTSAEDAVIKSRKDAVNATNYLTQADQRMAAALNTSNAALDKAGTDSLVKYETALRKSGISQDVATAKLAKYKAQLEQVQIQEQKRREEHLTRALAPQATDIVVSLWSGQNPLTVLLQQGGQVTDLFMRSGVAAEKFGEVVKSSMKSMLPSILTVVKGVGGLLVDGFMAAGNAAKGFIADIFGVTGALDKWYMKMSENGPSKWGGAIQRLSSLISGVFAGGVAAGTAVLVAIGVAIKQVISENDNLARSMAQSGASMAISTSQAFAYAKSMNDVDISTGKAVVAITEMAKAGNFASSDIPKVTEAAVNLNKYLGVSIEDTVKAYSKLKDEPVKAILDLAKASGNIPPKIIETIIELERQGEVAKATSLAMTARFENDKKVIEDAKKNLSGFSTFVISLGNTISNFFSNTFKNIWYATDPTDELQKNLDEVRKKIKDVSATLESNKSWGISGDPKLLNSLKEQERMIISQIGAQVRLRGEEEKRKFLNAENAKHEEAVLKLRKGAEDSIEKETRKTETLADFRKNFIDDKLKDAAKENAVDVEKIRLNTDLMKLLQQQADIEYKRIHKKEGKQGIKDLETEIDLRNKQLGLLGSFNNELAAIERRRAKTGDEDQYQASLNALIEKQPIYIERQKEINAAHDLENKLLGKADMLGKDYYKTLEQIQEFQDSGLYSPEKAEKLRQAAFDQTELAKTRLKIEEDSYKLVEKYRDENEKALNSTVIENAKLDDRLALLGLTSEQQKYLRIEQERRNKLLAIDLKLQTQIQEVWDKWGSGGFGQNGATKAKAVIVELEKAAAEERKTINREVAVQYKEDLQKEFDAIKNGISDSIVTALFEGGKAGSKKFRDLVVAQLRKPVTMVVNAVVNTLLGNTLGSLMGGAASAATGGGDLVGTASNVASAYRAASSFNTGWLTNFGATMPGSIASTGANLYSQGFETIGSSMMDFGNSIAQYSDAINTAGDVLGYGAAIFAAANGKWGQAIGSAVGTYFGGPIGSFLGSTIGSWADDIFSGGAGTPHTGAGVIYSAEKGTRGGVDLYGTPSAFNMGHRDEYNPEVEKLIGPLAISLGTTFDGIAKTFGKTAGYEIATAFADDSSGDGAWGSFRISKDGQKLLDWRDTQTSRWAPKEFGDGEEGYKQYLAAIAKDTRQVILDMDLPSWADKILTDLGESASMESLSSAIQQIGVIKGVFDTMTNTLVGLSGASDETLAALMTLSGGIEALSANATAYYQNFYSAEQQRANVQKQLAKSFNELGLSMIDIDAIDARQQFRDLVEKQDLTTESGRKAFAALLAIAGTFASVTTTVEEAAAEASAALDNARQAWKDGVQSAYDILEAAINAQIKILNEQAGASEATISKLKGIFDLLKSSISDLYGEVASTAAMQASQGYQVIRDAISTGNLPEQSTLSSAISAVRSGISGTDFVSQFEADKARLQFAADLNTLLGQTEEQLSTEELTLKAIKDQIAMLELTLANAKAQLDAINGVNTSVLSVADAIREFQNALIPPTTTNLKEPPRAPSGSAGGRFSSGPGGDSTPIVSNTDQIKDYLNHISLEPVDIRTQMLTRGWTVEEIAAAAGVDVDFARSHIYKDVPAFADGGSYRGGMALVGEEGPELINFSQGGQVYTASQTASMLSGGDVVGAIESLENRVTDLGYALQAIAINTGKSSRVLERVTPDGDSILISGSVTVA